MYELRETLFEKLERFNLPVSEENKLLNNLAVFNFESICVATEELKETKTTTWIGKHVPISVFISSNLIDEPIFLYNKDPKKLIIDFVSKVELLGEKKKLEMGTKFQDIELAVNERMKKIKFCEQTFSTFNYLFFLCKVKKFCSQIVNRLKTCREN